MFRDAMIRLGTEDSTAAMAEIRPLLKGGGFDTGNVTVLGHDLSFYPGYRFLDIADHDTVPAFRKTVIYKPGDVIVLDGTNGPLYALNRRAPLNLSPLTVDDYARFFFSHVRSPQGRFLIVEGIDDINWREDPPPAARKALGKMIVPLTLAGRAKDGTYRLTGCVVFKNTLYRAVITVSTDGQISLADQEALVEDMPLQDDTLGQ